MAGLSVFLMEKGSSLVKANNSTEGGISIPTFSYIWDGVT